MSDRRPPEPPPTPEKRPPSPDKPESFNWKVFILFLVAGGILLLAWQVMGKPSAVTLDYPQFRQHYYADNIYHKGDLQDKPEIVQEYKLQFSDWSPTFISAGNGNYGTIKGLINIVDKRNLDAEATNGQAFFTAINTPEGHKILDNFKPESIASFTYDADPSKKLKVDPKNAISVTELRKLYNSKSISKLSVVKSPETGQIIASGHRLNYPTLTYAEFTKRLSKKHKGAKVTQAQFDRGIALVPYSVNVNLNRLTDSERAFFNDSTSYGHDDGGMRGLLLSLIPIFLIFLLLIFLFRHQMKSAGKGAMSFGKSKARLLSQEQDRVTFKDVAGIQEAKEELYEIVDFLKGPKKFEKLGGNIPKGVLMVGPPGTGKTLLARAIAGEADVPFFSISGSDFVEMFVGVGASRVRDMFEQGQKNSPCIVFIDEIDAVGRHRGHGHGGGNDEREQTLNALLVEMDGFDARSGVIIIAATNRPDVLDPALLRPGRFDRQVTVALPDYKGREQILKVHAKKIKLKEDTNLNTISKGTPGFSGAELANLINEAALLAARKGLQEVTLAELEEARDKVRWGRERRSLAMSNKDKENTAYHEAGHAICNLVCDHTDNLHKVTIIPRGPALGMAMFLPEEDRLNYREAELIDQLCVAMGGRVAEELVFGNVTNGAMGDIRQATTIARKMVCEWGMSQDLGMVDYGTDEQQEMFMSSTKGYSEETARKIDLEIKELIDAAYKRAVKILTEKREALNLVSEALLEYETLDGEQINDLLQKGVMDNPPSNPTPPEPPLAPNQEEEKAKAAPVNTEDDDDEPFAPETVKAPA